VLQHPTSIDIIAKSLACDNSKTKIAVLEILGAVCLVQGGHKKVLDAFVNFQDFAAERTRFQSIMNDLDRSIGSYRDETNLKVAIMSLINALVNYGAGEDQLEFRLHLRFEFIMLGVEKTIVKLRKYENETLDRHLDFFDMVRLEDEKELSRKFSNESIEAESAIEIFDLLRRKLNYSAAYPHFLSLLQHMMLLPFTSSNTHYWLLFDRILQQIVLQQSDQRPSSEIESFFEEHMPSENSKKPKFTNPDVSPIEIDVNQIVKLLVREEELINARRKAEELERENLEFVAKLSKKERELDLRTTEKEDLETNLTRMRERLEKESTNHSQAVTRAINAEMKIEDLQHKLVNEQQERVRLEKLMSEGSFPDDQKAAGLQANKENCNVETMKAPPPPPPPIPQCAPPPPPPGKPIERNRTKVKAIISASSAQHAHRHRREGFQCRRRFRSKRWRRRMCHNRDSR
jgi:dishevelled associated activator of morphogenesis